MLQVLVRFAPSLLLLVIALRVRVIQRAFRDAGATTPATAVALRALPVSTRGLPIRILARHGVVVATGDGRHYLDLAAAERWRRRRRIVLPIVLVLLAAGLVVVYLMGLSQR